MAYKNQFMKSAFLDTHLQNGVGRQINQLMRVTLKFCKNHGGSKGAREFIEKHLENFATENQSVVVYVKPRRHRSPVLVAEYLNGERRWMSIHNKECDEIFKWMNLLTLQAGDTEPVRYRKFWSTDIPSIQGPWTPWTHKNPETLTADYPNNDLGQLLNQEESATEKLIRLYKEKKEPKSQE